MSDFNSHAAAPHQPWLVPQGQILPSIWQAWKSRWRRRPLPSHIVLKIQAISGV